MGSLQADIDQLAKDIVDLKGQAEALKARMADFLPTVESLRTRAAVEVPEGPGRDTLVDVLGQLETVIQKMNATVN